MSDSPRGGATLDHIAALETIAADALPSAVFERYDGWCLRFNHGVTRRANSVLAEAAGALELDRKVERVEAFYASHGAPPRFQLTRASQPQGLDALLTARGYRLEPGALVQVGSVSAAPLAAGFGVHYHDLPSSDWLDILATVDAKAATGAEARALELQRRRVAAAHAVVVRDGIPVAAGLGVLGSGHVGLFNMATHPDQRRRGAGSAVVAALADWARRYHAHTLYLQVDARNDAGHAFYAQLGFVTSYRYHYRSLEAAD